MLRSTRRELLAAFLGAPFALSGCGRGRPPLPPGEVVGANVSLGHRLRDGPIPRPDRWDTVPLVIVGAGIAGLSAAWRLRRKGFPDFALLELESAPGGTARSGARGVVPYPWGAHYLPAPMKENAELIGLLREMGVVEGPDNGEPVYAEHVLCRAPQERLFAFGRWGEGLWPAEGASSEDGRQRRQFYREVDRWVAWRDDNGRRAFALPTRASSRAPEVLDLDRMTMDEWMKQRGFTSRRLRWSVAYACRDDYGAEPTEVSAWAGLFYFASRRRTPGGPSQGVLTWPEGNGRLVAHLARGLERQMRTGLAALDINPTAGGVQVTAVREEGGVVGLRARHVILAAPRFIARHVVRPWRERAPRWASDFIYGSWAVANLHLRNRPREPGFPLAWDNVLYDSPSLGYVVATHQKGIDHGPTVFTYYYPLTGEDASAERQRLLSAGRDEWAEVALADLERAHPDIRHLVERLDVMRWGHAMVRPRPGLFRGPTLRQARGPFRAIHFAHCDLSGLALFEEAFDHGLRAADEVLAAR